MNRSAATAAPAVDPITCRRVRTRPVRSAEMYRSISALYALSGPIASDSAMPVRSVAGCRYGGGDSAASVLRHHRERIVMPADELEPKELGRGAAIVPAPREQREGDRQAAA